MIIRGIYVMAATVFTIATASSQNASVLFSVNMNQRIDQGSFVPSSDYVDVAGTFNGWDGSSHRLTDGDLDGIYEIVVEGFTAGESIEYKFRTNGRWDGNEEFPNGGPNRAYTVLDGENVILVWYNNEIPEGMGFMIDFVASTTSFYSGGVVEFTNTTAGTYDRIKWLFEGGQPAASSETNPWVYFDHPGSYEVALIVEDESSVDTLVKANYVVVKERVKSVTSWWNERVFYELFVRSFQDSDGDGIGDFQGIINRLDYLNDGNPETSDDLGINGIWLMPIHPSPSYHGYDVTDYLGINPDYGTLEDFRLLVKEAHERGIRIIIDYVMNHSSREHPWFVESAQSITGNKRNWYRWENQKPNQTGPWGQNVWHQHNTGFYYGLFWDGMPDLNYREEDVREAMYQAADFWLNDVGIDGFRLDAVKYILEDDNILEDSPGTLNFWKEYQARIKSFKPDAFSIGEAWTNSEQVVAYVDDNNLDMCFEFDLAGAILQGVNDHNAGRLLSQIQKAYNLYPHLQFGTFLTNHDMNRVMEAFNGSLPKSKTAAAIYLTLPGTPFIYYGEEIGMRGSKPDEFIRKPMQWSPSTGAGFTTGIPWITLNSDYPNVNVEHQQADPNSLFQQYKKLIGIRNDSPALRTGEFLPVPANDTRILAFMRYMGQSRLLVLINLSDQQLNEATIDLGFSSIDPGEYNATELISDSDYLHSVNTERKSMVQLKPREVKIIQLLETTSVFDLNRTVEKIEIIPNPVGDYLELVLDNTVISKGEYMILDLVGRVRHSGPLANNRIRCSGLEAGMYFLRVESGDLHYQASFIKE